MTDKALFQSGMLANMRLGGSYVPGLLLRSYARLGLSEVEVMLLIHLHYFASHEGTLFPTPEEIADRMSAAPNAVMSGIERLVRDGMLSIEDDDAVSGVRGERYDLSPLYEKLASVWTEAAPKFDDPHPQGQATVDGSRQAVSPESAAMRRRNIYTVFESEFARPLSPMEYETISNWIDADGLSDQLILAALKEAVFAGKVHFRYIDRILMEWRKHRVTTPEEAKSFTQRFRGG